MNTPQTIYVVLANPAIVWILLFFVNDSSANYARFIWNTIDYMRDPDIFFEVLNAKYS